DEIMRRSGVNQNIVNSNIFKSLWEEDLPIEHSMISRSVEQAQVKMEGYNFDIRKHLVEYDDVVNTHRDVIYNERRYILKSGDPRPIISEMIMEKVQELAGSSEDGRGKKGRGSAGYTTLFEALKETFPEDVIRRLLRSILADRLAPIAEEGDAQGLAEELKLVAQDAYEGVLESQVKSVDEKLQDFYHIGDVYYEIAGEGTLDYSKLSRTIGLPPEVIRKMEDEEMQYEEARDFLTEIMRANYERDISPRLQKLQEHLEAEAGKVVASGEWRVASSDGADDENSRLKTMPSSEAKGQNSKLEMRVRSLLDTIDANFALSSASAARYVEAERAGRDRSIMAAGEDSVVLEVQEQLEVLYAEVEKTLGDVFVETNQQLPLIAMVDNRLPRPVYRRIEEQLGLEGLEQVENVPLGQLDEEVREIVTNAVVRWQEADLMLRVIDYLWTRHLTTMEGLRHSIGLQAYGQKDPLVQYKVKAYEMFDELKGEIRQLVVLNVLLQGSKAEAARASARATAAQQAARQATSAPVPGDGRSKAAAGGSNGKPRPGQPQQRPGQKSSAPVPVGAGANRPKIGRNDPCFCGSGRKFKHCHGR
ncbi:MAG: SEC-C metal-binding domain-containing protein, partial [Chloroflexota bacterium]|nr:SEC-C metal-binding domain-containing protein [Chloroflexota bacterium]